MKIAIRKGAGKSDMFNHDKAQFIDELPLFVDAHFSLPAMCDDTGGYMIMISIVIIHNDYPFVFLFLYW